MGLWDGTGTRMASEKYNIILKPDSNNLLDTYVKVKWEMFYGCIGKEITIFKGSFPTPEKAAQAGAKAIENHRLGQGREKLLKELRSEYTKE